MNTLMILLVVFQVKHFICDYPLQGRYMLGKFKPGMGFILPLLAHVSVHGAMTGLIGLVYGLPASIVLGCVGVDMSVHFIMDRIKASPALLGRYKPMSSEQMKDILLYESKGIPLGKVLGKRVRDNTLFWHCLGLDQMVHHLTHYLVIAIMIGMV